MTDKKRVAWTEEKMVVLKVLKWAEKKAASTVVSTDEKRVASTDVKKVA